MWGIVNDRMGARFTAFVAGIVFAATSVLQWAMATGRVGLLGFSPTVSLSAIGVINIFGASALTATYISTAVRNFPHHRGVVTGIANGWVGLCGGMYTAIYTGFEGSPSVSPKTLNFLLLCGVITTVNCVLPSGAMVVHQIAASQSADAEREESFNFAVCYAVLAVARRSSFRSCPAGRPSRPLWLA